MVFEKKGLICNKEIISLDWYKKNVMCPVPYLRESGELRVYVAFCDEDNKGRIGYIDVNPENPSEIISYSKKPVLDIGMPGMFDDSGVLPNSLVKVDGKIYMYYSGFQRHINIPYASLLGVCVSDDDGESFIRGRCTPVLDRTENELFIRTGAYVDYDSLNKKYTLYYASGKEWFKLNDKLEPVYSLKTIQSDNPLIFDGEGKNLMELINDEYGLTIPQIIDNYLLFSSRSKKNGYRLKLASNSEGKYVRSNEEIILNGCEDSWDREMQCFGKVYKYNEEEYLFYCGNHYGIGGLGWAKRVKN